MIFFVSFYYLIIVVTFYNDFHTNLRFHSAEKSGKTLHLLKSNSKPIKPRS